MPLVPVYLESLVHVMDIGLRFRRKVTSQKNLIYQFQINESYPELAILFHYYSLRFSDQIDTLKQLQLKTSNKARYLYTDPSYKYFEKYQWLVVCIKIEFHPIPNVHVDQITHLVSHLVLL